MLSSKGVQLPLHCPMCVVGEENILHLFFYCSFARLCWLHVGGSYNMQGVEDGPAWVLQKICNCSNDEVPRMAKVLWGI